MAAAPEAEKMGLFGFCQKWPLIYSEELYRKGGSYGSPCKNQFDGPPHEKMACIGETNAIMAVLEAEVAYPLSAIHLHERIYASAWDPKLVKWDSELVKDVTRVFLDRMRVLAPPPDSKLGPCILKNRADMRQRARNLVVWHFVGLATDLAEFYQRHLSIDDKHFYVPIVGDKESVVDTIACWTAFCALRGLVSGDGTYTGRAGVVESKPPIVKKAAPQAAPAQPQQRFTVVSPEEYQRLVQEGERMARPASPGTIAAHERSMEYYHQVERNIAASQEAHRDWSHREFQREQARQDQRRENDRWMNRH